jgi:hypothetical protein
VQVGPFGAYFPRALFGTPFVCEAFAARDGLEKTATLTISAQRAIAGDPWNL